MEFCLRETYLKMIERSVGSKMFQSSFFKAEGKEKDLCDCGRLSCAFYVSSILKIFDLVKTLHTTVDGLERDLIVSGWEKYESLLLPAIVEYVDLNFVGSVVVWSGTIENNHHRHSGFYLGKGDYVSNWSAKRIVSRHYGSQDRLVEAVYWHPKLQ